MDCKPNRFSWRLMWYAVASAVLSIALAVLRKQGLVPASLAWLAALLPVLPMVGFFFGLARWLRSIDELERTIHLEALMVQFGATGVLVMAYGALAKAGIVPNLTASDASGFLFIAIFAFWSVGLLAIRRKYR